MTGEVINLRKVRKAKARTLATADAAANRARFGRTKAERLAQTRDAERLARAIDGARHEHPADGGLA